MASHRLVRPAGLAMLLALGAGGWSASALQAGAPVPRTAVRLSYQPLHASRAACPAMLGLAAPPIEGAAASGPDAHSQATNWCAASGREEATVTVLDAQDTAQAMRDFWYIAHAMGEASEVGQRVIALPRWSAAADPRFFSKVLNHLSMCSEACEHLGDTLMVSGRHPRGLPAEDEAAAPFPLLLLRGFKGASAPTVSAEDSLYPGEEIPWFYLDDDEADELDPVKNDARKEGGHVEEVGGPPPPPPAADVSDAEVLEATTKWVDAVVVHMKVCPFSATTYKAGLPMGGVTYPLTRATTAEEVYFHFWQECENLALTDERTLSTVLLVTPEYAQNAPGVFDALADTLNDALSSLGEEKSKQLVFFHPQYTFRDGTNRAGGDAAAANFARRSPYPMINLLRTPQVRAAQKGVPTGSVYTTNEKNLAKVGTQALEGMLQSRDWAAIHEGKFTPHNVDVIRGV